MRLLLDEHYSPAIARELRRRGHEAVSVVEREDLVERPDHELLTQAGSERLAVVTKNARDFVPLARRAAASGASHYGIVLSSPRAMPRSAGTIGVFVGALELLLLEHPADDALSDQVRWLQLASASEL